MPGNLASVPSLRRAGALAGALLVAVGAAACGQGRQDVTVPNHVSYPVQVTATSFPTSQTLSEHTSLVIKVRNAGHQAIPNLAVSVCPNSCDDSRGGTQATSSAVFGSNQGPDSLDNPSPPDWIVDQNPGPCSTAQMPQTAKYSCQAGTGGAWATEYPNTWAVDKPVLPGVTKTFQWKVVPVQPGHFTVAWRVASDLYDKTGAVLVGGGVPQGVFHVTVSSAPAQSYVNNNGQIVSGSGQP